MIVADIKIICNELHALNTKSPTLFGYPFQGSNAGRQFHAVDGGFVVSLREHFLVWTV